LAEGPVFAEFSWNYKYQNGNEFSLKAIVGSRDSAIYWDMTCFGTSSLGTISNDGWRLFIDNSLSLPIEFEYNNDRDLSAYGPNQKKIFPLSEEPAGKIVSLTPWAQWFDYKNEVLVVLTETGTQVPVFFGSVRDDAMWLDPDRWPYPPSSWSGLPPPSVGYWSNAVNGPAQLGIPFAKHSDGRVSIDATVVDAHAPGTGGNSRRWITGFLSDSLSETFTNNWNIVSPASDSQPHDYDSDYLNYLGEKKLSVRFNKRRLDTVKEFVLDWNRATDGPTLIVDQTKIDAASGVPAGLTSEMQYFSNYFSYFLNSWGSVLGRQIQIANGRPNLAGSQVDMAAIPYWLLTKSPQIANDFRLAERIKARIGEMENIDLIRSAPAYSILYDAIINSSLINDTERAILNARMAYIGYYYDDPGTWSVERNWITGNPNMTVSVLLSKGIIGSAVKGHPKANEWIAKSIDEIETIIAKTGQNGEWYEGAWYDHVSATQILSFLIVLKNAGSSDYSSNSKIKSLFEYLAKQYTPPDPMYDNRRVTPPFGRANAGLSVGLFGCMARFTRDTDQNYSSHMQWMWEQSGRSYLIGDGKLGGLEWIYIDANGESQKPQWISEWFPKTTAVLRHRFGGPNEDYVSFLVTPGDLLGWPSEFGAMLKWFAFGVPVAGAFAGGFQERHEMLISKVLPSNSYSTENDRVENFAHSQTIVGTPVVFTEPNLDYIDATYNISGKWRIDVGNSPLYDANSLNSGLPDLPHWPSVSQAGVPPISWRRQVAFVKAIGPNESSYLVFKDTVNTNTPTIWQFWTTSLGINDLSSVGDLLQKESIQSSRSLSGNQFVAQGQHGIDVDFFVLNPSEPQAFTLRWGKTYASTPIDGRKEHQDLLQLRREGSGSYIVLAIPRPSGDPPPVVASYSGGNIIKVQHSYGQDTIVFGGQGVEDNEGNMFEVPVFCKQTRGSTHTITAGPSGNMTIDGEYFEVTEPTTFVSSGSSSSSSSICTPCGGGECPECGWVCCPDNLYCAPTLNDCP
jgi:hypothetical protein